MKYNPIISGTFIERPNRFIAYVKIKENNNDPEVVSSRQERRAMQGTVVSAYFEY